MKSNELRLGNLLYINQTVVTVNYNTFRSISLKKINLKPIPLTEEWILKFGFYKYYVTKEDNQIWRKDGKRVILT